MNESPLFRLNDSVKLDGTPGYHVAFVGDMFDRNEKGKVTVRKGGQAPIVVDLVRVTLDDGCVAE